MAIRASLPAFSVPQRLIRLPLRSERLRLAIWLGAVSAGSNVTVPLLLLYRARMSLDPSTVTALFGVYALGLLPALAIGGPAADRWGERRVGIPASIAAIFASCLFVIGHERVPLLFGARVLQGFASGMVFTVGTAWLSKSRGLPGTGGRTAAVGMTAGFSTGSLVGGVLGEWGVAPTTLPYLVHIAAVCFGLSVIWKVPDGRSHIAVTRRQASQGVLNSVTLRAAFLKVAPCAVCVFGFPAIAINAVPTLVGVPGPAVIGTGLLAAVTLGVGTAVAPLQRLLKRWTEAVAAACGALGFALIAVAAASTSARLLVVPAVVLLGAGGGFALSAGLVRLPILAAPGRIATVSAGFYALAYIGFGVPFMLAEIRGKAGVIAPFLVLVVLAIVLFVHQVRVAFHPESFSPLESA